MGKLSIFHKVAYGLNILFAVLLLASFPVPHISVANFPLLSALSLIVPLLAFVNVVFLIYWILFKKRQFLLSFTVLVLGLFFMDSFIVFSGSDADSENTTEELKILSFNARGFDRYHFFEEEGIGDKIVDFVYSQSPDIVCFQEFYYVYLEDFGEEYPYQYLCYEEEFPRAVMATISRYPILDSGSLRFPKSSNNGCYSDILFQEDTLRIYNLHLESAKVIPTAEALSSEPSGKLMKRLSKTFVKQQEQAELVNNHRKNNPHKKIICGDFNNTQFSNVYKTIKGSDMADTFLERGFGLGRTFSFFGIPQRIDFIMSDDSFEVLSHQNFDVELSDHYPVMATLKIHP